MKFSITVQTTYWWKISFKYLVNEHLNSRKTYPTSNCIDSFFSSHIGLKMKEIFNITHDLRFLFFSRFVLRSDLKLLRILWTKLNQQSMKLIKLLLTDKTQEAYLLEAIKTVELRFHWLLMKVSSVYSLGTNTYSINNEQPCLFNLKRKQLLIELSQMKGPFQTHFQMKEVFLK